MEKNMDFNGFRWIEMGFHMENIWILMGLDEFEMGFNMEKYRF